jgi:hypothetical protein
MTIFYCLIFQTPPNLERQIPVFISPRNRVAQLYTPRHWVPFSSPPTARRATVEVFEPRVEPRGVRELNTLRCFPSTPQINYSERNLKYSDTFTHFRNIHAEVPVLRPGRSCFVSIIICTYVLNFEQEMTLMLEN